MSTIALIACSSKKTEHGSQAANLYTSDLFRKSKAYASIISDRWYILSAKHGLLSPHEVIEPYNVTLNEMNKKERESWANHVWEQITSASDPLDDIIILAGKKYSEGFIQRLHIRGNGVADPLRGMAIGQRLAWLKKHIE